MDVGLDDRTLRRTSAMLVALAVLAERAASRSFPVRWLVLALLRYAERVARAYVAEITQWEWPGFDDDLEPGSSAYDAALLAWRLRLLAAVLGALLPPEDRLDDWNTGRDAAPRGLAAHALSASLFGRPYPAPDTS